jgi:hypothetical protein
VPPNSASKGNLRQQLNLHVSHTGSFLYRRTTTVDGAALPFAIQQPCRPLLSLYKLSVLWREHGDSWKGHFNINPKYVDEQRVLK